MGKTKFQEAMDKIEADIASSDPSGEYEPKISKDELLETTAAKVDELNGAVINLSVANDVHLALHFVGAPELVMQSAELFFYLCQARAVRYETETQISVSELEEWANGDMLEVLHAHKDLWEAKS